MNILYVLANSLKENGGIGAATMALQKSLAKRGHKIKFCCYKTKIDIDSFLLPNNSNVKSGENIKFLNNLIKTENIDIIVNQFGQEKDFCFLCGKARSKTEAKLVTCHHFALLMFLHVRTGLIAKILPKFLVYKLKKIRELRIRNFAYNNSDRLVLLSNKFIDQYKKLAPNKNLCKLVAIPDPLIFAPQKIDLQRKQKTILFVGRMVEAQKRISLIIKLWRQICRLEKYAEWNLKLIGDGEDLYNLKQSAANLPRISFEGYQNPLNYYENASVFLMCSEINFEGFGMVLIEAQSCGCVPVVMDAWASLNDIVKNEENGFIVPNNDMKAFVDKTRMLMDNPELMQQMMRNGIESSRKFNADKLAIEWEILFKSLKI